MPPRTFHISGRAIQQQSEQSITNARIEAWNKNLIFTDLVVNITTVAIVTPATVVAKHEGAINEAIHQNIGDSKFLKLCAAKSQKAGSSC